MDIGSKIRAIRNRKKITIAEMCEATGLSKGFISNVENNNTSPSISTLETIAEFLGVPLPYLLLKKEQHMRVVRKDERTYSTHNQLKIEHIASKDGLRLMIAELPPGASIGEPNAHEGIECHLVLEGRVLAEQGEDSYIVEEGDSFSWNACVPHFVKNIGEEKAVVLIAVYSEQGENSGM
ncbi:helix-turn-helix domain-containing protein [Calidifontibacillus erzurumensis]|uniref:Helix-turn-helix transcriptional regulator n=1 Tax=Calidifontibacillus erzurumensis TaxID=2741433 RepID=A0A8J8GEL0_9BACI|nr:XRE family transcriptional regulator [Calidifontibacillus erzurumensis]NSL50825.1 helix-turn-helix transcriptional regulator [Calidifontibacillus erzurumensis]